MLLVYGGLLLLLLKWLEVGPVAAWSWLYVLAPFGLAFIWFEYWISAVRLESLTAARHMLDQVRAFLVEMISDLPVADADEAAHAVLSWLLGTIVQQHVSPKSADALRRELERVLSV